MSEFLQMGGYAPFVWGAWGASTGVLVALVGYALVRRHRLTQKLKRLEAQDL